MTTDAPEMKIGALAPWFGGNRTLAATVGRVMGRIDWCGVVFTGGAPELPHLNCRAGVANDLHCHLINMARVVRDELLVERMIGLVDDMLFHPVEYAEAQARCVAREAAWPPVPEGGLFGAAPAAFCTTVMPDVRWAADYFACCWMGRGGSAGQENEFAQQLAMRWTPTGGSSAKRWRSAVESLRAWNRALRHWEFTRLDAFEFLAQVKDMKGVALYVDAPWPDAGERYEHKFTTADQVRLAARLAAFRNVRIVVRFGDHPLIRDLYQGGRGQWTWIEQESRNQQGNGVAEVLIVNGGVA